MRVDGDTYGDTADQLGHAAFEAWRTARAASNMMPVAWLDLPIAERRAWTGAALAVIKCAQGLGARVI